MRLRMGIPQVQDAVLRMVLGMGLQALLADHLLQPPNTYKGQVLYDVDVPEHGFRLDLQGYPLGFAAVGDDLQITVPRVAVVAIADRLQGRLAEQPRFDEEGNGVLYCRVGKGDRFELQVGPVLLSFEVL